MPFDFDPAAHGLTLDDTQAAVLKAALGSEVQKFLDGEVSGLKTKNTELIGSNKAIKTELDKLKGQFEGLDIDAVKGLLAKAGQDEETKLIAEGKLDEVISRRTERLRTDLDKQVKVANERAEKAEAFAAKYSDKVLADSIRAAAIKAGALPEAAEDIILRARGTFKLSEDGEPVATDRAGEVVYGKDGKTPLSPLGPWHLPLSDSGSPQPGWPFGGCLDADKPVVPRITKNTEQPADRFHHVLPGDALDARRDGFSWVPALQAHWRTGGERPA